MTGFLIGTISDLSHVASISICFLTAPHNEKFKKKGLALPSDHDGGGFISLYPKLWTTAGASR